jgi:hypothetical protein
VKIVEQVAVPQSTVRTRLLEGGERHEEVALRAVLLSRPSVPRTSSGRRAPGHLPGAADNLAWMALAASPNSS